jgi:hypothetical protein
VGVSGVLRLLFAGFCCLPLAGRWGEGAPGTNKGAKGLKPFYCHKKTWCNCFAPGLKWGRF